MRQIDVDCYSSNSIIFQRIRTEAGKTIPKKGSRRLRERSERIMTKVTFAAIRNIGRIDSICLHVAPILSPAMPDVGKVFRKPVPDGRALRGAVLLSREGRSCQERVARTNEPCLRENEKYRHISRISCDTVPLVPSSHEHKRLHIHMFLHQRPGGLYRSKHTSPDLPDP